jgi:hypothetical protein
VGSRAVRRLLPVTDLRGHFAGIGDLQVLHDRLCASGADQPRVQRAAAEVKRNITHLRARGSMPSRKLRRVPVVLRELASFRYHRYSHGALSAGKDLFLS